MLKNSFVLLLLITGSQIFAQESVPAVKYSQVLLDAVRTGQPTDKILADVNLYNPQSLAAELKTDNQKKAFWLNIYNAYVQIGLAGKTGKVNNSFFRKKIALAGQTLTLNKIEKELLRPGNAGPDSLDYRIHFALNKGTASSPAIIIYEADKINEQLKTATAAYLKKTVKMDEEGLEAEAPAVLKKNRSDFGGKEGVLKILRENEVIFMNRTPKLEYHKEDKTILLKNFLAPAERN